MHISMMGSLILRCAFLLLLAIDTGLAQQTDMYSQTSFLTSATPNEPRTKLDRDEPGSSGLIFLVVIFVGPACLGFCLYILTFFYQRVHPKRWLRRFRERHRPDRRSSCPSLSDDDQQPPLSQAPVTDHQPNQQEIDLLVYTLNMRTNTMQHHLAGIERLSARVNGLITQASDRRNPSDQPSMNTNEALNSCVDQPSNPSAGDNIETPPPPYSHVTSPRQGPAPPPPIPPPSYSDAMSPPRRKQWKRRPAPPPPIPPPPYSDVPSPPPIPPPSYSDVTSPRQGPATSPPIPPPYLPIPPLDYRHNRDSDPGRGPPYITHMLRRFRERHRPDRRSSCPSLSGGDQHSESAPPSADDQQPPLSPAPVTDHQPNQQEIELLVHSLNMRTNTIQHHLAGIERLSARANGLITQASGRRNPSDQPSMNTNKALKVCLDQPSYPSAGDMCVELHNSPDSDVTLPPQGPAPRPQIPPPSYSDAVSPPRRKQWKRRPAPPPSIPPPPYSDVTLPPQGPAPRPQIPPPSYSDAVSPPRRKQWKRRPAPPPSIPPPPYSDTSPRQGPAPPPPIPPLIPPPSYSDAMSLPLDYRHTRDSDPCRGPPYITHM